MFRSLLGSVARMFDSIEVPYMVIGGQATLIYGEPRLTQDIDVTIGAGPDRLTEVLAGVREAGWKVLVGDPVGFVNETMVLPCVDTNSNIRLDIVFSFSPYEAEAISRAVTIDIDGTQVRYAAVEDLIVHKIFAGRPRDLEDVRGIMLRQERIDEEYIRHWLTQFDQSFEGSFLEGFRKIREEVDSKKDDNAS